jgi:hypothetical protein
MSRRPRLRVLAGGRPLEVRDRPRRADRCAARGRADLEVLSGARLDGVAPGSPAGFLAELPRGNALGGRTGPAIPTKRSGVPTP